MVANNSSVQSLVATLKSKKWIDLTHSFGPESPRFPEFKPAKFHS